MSAELANQVGRVADALFAQAKAQREQVKLTERTTLVQEELLAMQKVNMAVTKALEQQLMLAATPTHNAAS